MALTPEERARVEEEARVAMMAQAKAGGKLALKVFGCLGIGLVVLMLGLCSMIRF